jgi:Cu/Ag efflux pump CusA
VLMTALTAALGVLPIAILGGAGRELEQPLAIVIVGGMFSSTALTLVVIPALFNLYGRKALHGHGLELEEYSLQKVKPEGGLVKSGNE